MPECCTHNLAEIQRLDGGLAKARKELRECDENVERMRKVLRGMVLVVTDASSDAQSKMSAALGTMNDTRLAAVAQEALSNFKRAKSTYDALEAELQKMRKDLSRIRSEHAIEERGLLEAQKAIKERDDIAARYKELQKQSDPEKQQLEVMYAIDEATKAMRDESAGLRRDLGQRQSEISELRASKKRLREALDRLAGRD